MRYAICADTPYQMLNAVNLACNTIGASDSKDLFFGNVSEEMSRIFLKIKKYHIFDNVYEFNRISKNDTINYYLGCLTQGLKPEKFIRDSLKSKNLLPENGYDFITVTSATPMEIALTRLFPSARVVALDDGLGSYTGNIIQDNNRHKMLWRIFGRCKDKIVPECLYVNNMSFCESTLAPCLKELRPLSSCEKIYKDMIFDIFDFRYNKMYQERPLIYLSQPMDELGKGLLSKNREVESVLAKYEKRGIYRRHPRDLNETELHYWVDETPCVWELLCNSEINNDNILVSFCSTAQITPKILYGKEPWIIFTYRLFDFENTKIGKNRFKPIINQIKKSYERKEKILEPATLEELQDILDCLLC